MINSGKINRWNSLKKYGFITPINGGGDIYFHISELSTEYEVLIGETVTYTIGEDSNGRTVAVDINDSRSNSKNPDLSEPMVNKTNLYLLIATAVIIIIEIILIANKPDSGSSSSITSSSTYSPSISSNTN
jgi:cold shock CspA family protein